MPLGRRRAEYTGATPGWEAVPPYERERETETEWDKDSVSLYGRDAADVTAVIAVCVCMHECVFECACAEVGHQLKRMLHEVKPSWLNLERKTPGICRIWTFTVDWTLRYEWHAGFTRAQVLVASAACKHCQVLGFSKCMHVCDALDCVIAVFILSDNMHDLEN